MFGSIINRRLECNWGHPCFLKDRHVLLLCFDLDSRGSASLRRSRGTGLLARVVVAFQIQHHPFDALHHLESTSAPDARHHNQCNPVPPMIAILVAANDAQQPRRASILVAEHQAYRPTCDQLAATCVNILQSSPAITEATGYRRYRAGNTCRADCGRRLD